ncbi:MAG TPA: transposase [Gaiellaceae bacterium]
MSATLGAVPSTPRDSAAGVHHIWTNATGNWPYFMDDRDRQAWIALLERVADVHSWTVLAFCQMTTHVHAIVDVSDTSLSQGMQYLNREYSKRFNLRHDRSGHFVRRRFGSRRISSGRDLVGAYAYVVLNPVSEGMCPRAEDWRWSSYATTLGLTTDFGFVDAHLVLAELSGAVDALQILVTARAPLLAGSTMSR